jgi:hypothetical protein
MDYLEKGAVQRMKRIIMTGICLTAAVYTIGAMVAADSMAAPPPPAVTQCQQATKGEPSYYGEAYCKAEKTGGGYVFVYGGSAPCREIVEPQTGGMESLFCENKMAGEEFVNLAEPSEPFTGSGNEMELQIGGGKKIACESSAFKGEFTGAKEVGSVVAELSGCRETASEAPCRSAESGKIVTSKLKGEIGYLDKEAMTVGLSLEPAEGSLFASFKCESGSVKNTFEIRGGAIAQITSPLKELSLEGELQYEQKEGEQAWTKFEGGAEQVLETSENEGKFSKSAIAGQELLELAFPTEIRM